MSVGFGVTERLCLCPVENDRLSGENVIDCQENVIQFSPRPFRQAADRLQKQAIRCLQQLLSEA